ncbi:hypothetical protein PT974_07255 [Cladobotryum mycophilum]|uniref:Alkylmercury lyase n=1 Tax=Cladobotryum mycophilum TaxID=491253 RepID=A0ABR0SNZ4_9HYPO
MDARTRDIRIFVINHYLQTCRPPTVAEIAKETSSSPEEVNTGLEKLEALQHFTLYKKNVPALSPIAMAHPFSHLPTPYVVIQGERSWWANCAWCGFGLVSMLLRETPGQPVALKVNSGSVKEELRFDIQSEQVVTSENKNYVVHFAVPPSKFWIDVRYTCSTIQLFQSESEVAQWRDTHGFPKGAIINFDQLWRLAKAWYEDKADRNYDRKSPQEVDDLYTRLGMTDPFWKQ